MGTYLEELAHVSVCNYLLPPCIVIASCPKESTLDRFFLVVYVLFVALYHYP